MALDSRAHGQWPRRDLVTRLGFAGKIRLIFRPAFTLIVGVALVQLATGQTGPHAEVVAALAAAVVGPVIAVLVLMAVDPGFDGSSSPRPRCSRPLERRRSTRFR